jgi:aminoglycoside N3'-acetyltransferase
MDRGELERALDALALNGLNVLVHARVSSPDFDAESAAFLCRAILDRLGPQGTMLMPAFTLSDTIARPNRAAIAFHLDLPVSPELGSVAETFRRLPGALRGNHPSHSFAAHGPQARAVLSTQRDSNPLGPVKKLNVMRGDVLLLGAPLSSCVAIHLAEESAALAYLGRATALRINAAGYVERVVVERLPGCSRAFDRIEGRLDPTRIASAGTADFVLRRIPVRYLVQLAGAALAADPAVFVCDDAACSSCARKRVAAMALVTAASNDRDPERAGAARDP